MPNLTGFHPGVPYGDADNIPQQMMVCEMRSSPRKILVHIRAGYVRMLRVNLLTVKTP